MNKLPLTSSGATDLSALKEPNFAVNSVMPRTQTEQVPTLL